MTSPQRLEASRELIDKPQLGFEMLTDAGNRVAAPFGLRFTVSPDIKRIDVAWGINLLDVNGDESWTLPLPARDVIDRNGVIRGPDVDPDRTTRPEPSETVAAVRALPQGLTSWWGVQRQDADCPRPGRRLAAEPALVSRRPTATPWRTTA